MQWQPTPPPTGPALRPLGVGEIIDGGFRVFKRNLGPLVRITALFVVPVQILAILLQLSILPDQRTVSFGDFSQTAYVQRHSPLTIGLVLGLVAVLGSVLRLVAAGAITRLVSQDYLGHRADATESLRFAFARLWSLVGLTILTLLGVLVGGIAAVLPGIYLYISWSVATPALVVEGIGARRALGRSRKLVRGRWWPVLGYTIVIGLVTTLVPQIIVSVPAGIIASGSTAQGVIVSGVLNAAVSLFTTPFAAATIVLLYFDLRVRKEAFDIQMMASALDLAAPTGPGGPSAPGARGGFAAMPQPPPPPPPQWGAPPPS